MGKKPQMECKVCVLFCIAYLIALRITEKIKIEIHIPVYVALCHWYFSGIWKLEGGMMRYYVTFVVISMMHPSSAILTMLTRG